jgi:hypothetical protein
MVNLMSLWPDPAGNAVNISVNVPRGAVSWRLLRRPADAISGPDDPAASLIADDLTVPSATDIMNLQNGTTYFYWGYFRGADGNWLPQVAKGHCTPASTYSGGGPDVPSLVRDRLEAGLAIEVARRAVIASPKTNKIDVLLAPFALSDNLNFPVVSVHMDSDMPEVRGIGEAVLPDEHKRSGGWNEYAGWLGRVTLNVVGVTLNPVERGRLRMAIRRIIQANMGVFASRDLQLVEFMQRDHEDSETFNAPLYFTLGTFSCLAPTWITNNPDEVEAVEVVRIDPYTGEPNG